MLSVHRALEILRGLEALARTNRRHCCAQDAAIQETRAQIRARPTISFSSAAATTFPIALEGALKLKEISYIHAEGYSAAEMKHGPIALIDPHTPTVFLVPQDSMYEKTLANLAMIRARKGPIIALATEGDTEIAKDGRRCDLSAANAGAALSDPGDRAAATVRLSHRRRARLRRGQAAQPRQERDGGIKLFRHGPSFNGFVFMALKVIVRAETFVNYAMFSSGARRDPRACRGIWKRCCPASPALAPASLNWPWS